MDVGRNTTVVGEGRTERATGGSERAAAEGAAAAAPGGRLGEEVDRDVDAVRVVFAGRGAARARVGAAAADDGDVVGIALGGDLAVGQSDRAGALLVIAASVDGGAEELGAS